MTLSSLVTVVGVVVLVVGLVAHLVRRDGVHRIVSLNVASGGVMMVLLALAVRGDAGDEPDPVPQALVLTGIIVMAAITGVALALVRRVASADDEDERADPDADAGTQGAAAVQPGGDPGPSDDPGASDDGATT